MRCSRCALRPPQFAEIETKCLRPLSKIDRLGRYALPPDRQAGRSCTAMMPDGIIIDMHQSKIFPSLPRFTKWTFFFSTTENVRSNVSVPGQGRASKATPHPTTCPCMGVFLRSSYYCSGRTAESLEIIDPG
jgi:hypothetical protein